MKKNIFDKPRSSSIKGIFKDESVFYMDYIPTTLPCRNTQLNDITYNLENILNNKKFNNLLLYGPPGTGKTHLSQFILNQMCEYTTKVKYLYINAIQDTTRFSIFSKIATLFHLPLPRRGLALDEIYDRVKECLNKSTFLPIIIIDEIDFLEPKECSELLYDLCRTHINNKYFALILITNKKDFYLDLDARTQSTLFLTNIGFPKYTSLELKEILKERIEYGLQKDAITQDLVGYITGYSASRGGDARIAIDLLYKAALNAEKDGISKITKENLLKSGKLVDSIKFSQKIKFLSQQEKNVLYKISDGLTTSDLRDMLNIPDRSLRRYIQNLEKVGLIRLEEISTNKGRLRKIFLNFDKELLS